MKLIIPTEGKKKHYTKAFIDTKVKESLSEIIARRKNARRNARLVNIITR
jgi:hypothetical protein